MPRRLTALLLTVACLTPAAGGARAAGAVGDPLEPVATGGLAAVDRALAQLATHARLLVVGAHPDDEDTLLLAWVSRALGGESAYLSLSRGEGGQNLIGPELGVGLGLLRSGELLAARRIEGGRQFFTRAYDFGYTRSLDETLARWKKDVLLEDAMRVVRRFKPQVIVSVFPDDGGGGHGQHQAAGVVAHAAWRLAQDPDGFPALADEGLLAWRPQALYREAWFSPETATMEVPLGGLEPLTGRSVPQIAAASRSMHRSQDMGRTQPLGGADRALTWVAGGAGEASTGPFDGVDTRLVALAEPLPEGELRALVRARLAAVAERAVAARAALSPVALADAREAFVAILADLRAARDAVVSSGGDGSGAVAELLSEKIAAASSGLAAAASVALEARADREEVIPGGEIEVAVEVWNAGPDTIGLRRAELIAPETWAAPPVEETAREIAAGELVRFEPRWSVGAVEPTIPYFLRRGLDGDLYDLAGVEPGVLGLPFQPPPLIARVTLAIAGAEIALEREVVHVRGDQALGEVRRPLRAVPAVEVRTSPDLVIWPATAGTRRVQIHLRSNAAQPVAGQLDVALGAGPLLAPIEFDLSPDAPEATIPLELAPPPGRPTGEFPVRATARLAGGGEVARSYPLVDYPHVRPRPLPTRAETRVVRLDLRLPELRRLGYVRGASDRVPEVLERVGLPVEVLDPATLASGDLAVYDAIVVGSRAFETDATLRAANGRLVDYVEAGGLVIVQYQQYQYVDGGYAPLPLTIGRPHGRVTDETAPVRLLDPRHPVFVRPNRLQPTDWTGWVQERGLYFAETWDEGWAPLLALADPGQEPQGGALLVARVGRGTYVYTGLAFFRQLPAGVPGALRLFANLLALGEAPPEGGE